MKLGQVPRKRFSRFADEHGVLLCAEVMGQEGFSSDMSVLYHSNPPSAVVHAQEIPDASRELVDNQPLLPRLLTTATISDTGDLVSQRVVLCGNDDVLVSFADAREPSGLYRNAVGDELVYVHDGGGLLETVFGALTLGQGDYVVIPKGTTHRWVPGPALRALIFETGSHVHPPQRYLSGRGQYLQEAPYCELDLRRPEGPLLRDGRDIDVTVRTRSGLTRYTYATHPFDVVGWFGCQYPYALNIHDFSPIAGSFHRPPPVHQVFAAHNLVFCNFVPRILDFDPRAMPIPSFHSNVDSDELIFYAEGNFFSRKGSGIVRGAATLHPAGHIHGPHPGSMDKAEELVGKRTQEIAVMLDTFRPLRLGRAALATEDPDYVLSWSGTR